MAKEKLPLKEDGKPDYTKSSNPVVRWFANYWYFYKVPVLVIGFLVFLAIWFVVDIATNVTSDMRVIMISDTVITSDESPLIESRAGEFAADADGDGQVHVTSTFLNLCKEPKNEYELAAYDQVVTFMIDDDITFYIVDDYGYQYMQASEVVAPLSKFGVEYEGNEYRIPINDTFLFEDLDSLAKRGNFYFVIKDAQDEKLEKEEIAARYEYAAAIANALVEDLADNGSAN